MRRLLLSLAGAVLTAFSTLGAETLVSATAATPPQSEAVEQAAADVGSAPSGAAAETVSEPAKPTFLQKAANFWQEVKDDFYLCFIKPSGDGTPRGKYLIDGLVVTLQVALAAILLGLFIGFLVSIIRASHDKYGYFPLLNAVSKVYLTIIRGTPMVVQLLITYYIILRSVESKALIAILAFGINSGAYQAEILRAGITSIDPGQMEAGRALGLSYWRTMIRIILPQAVRNVLPALGNEFIVLMKDTSIVGYIALVDLAKGGDIIRSQTYSVYLPYLTVAVIYLVLVMTFTWLLGKLERHLRNTGADPVHNDS